VLLYGGLITAVTLGAFVWALQRGNPQYASTVAFMTLAFAQTAHLGTARSAGAVLRPSAMLANPFALAGVALAIALQLVALFVPGLAIVLHLSPLTAADWLVIVGAAAIPAITGQVIRAIRS
jgi:Ca2+-transporting ATPase